MKTYRLCAALAAAALAFPAAAGAQATSVYEPHDGERHVFGRLQGGVGVRLNDPYSQGAFAGGWVSGSVGYLVRPYGPIRLGVQFGGQFGYDPTYALPQGGFQGGLAAQWRISPLLAIMGRFEGSLLLSQYTASATNVGAHNMLPDGTAALGRYNMPYPTTNNTGRDPSGQAGLRYIGPTNISVGVVPGFELGIAPAIYVTSGIAVTGEVSLSSYFGDGGAYFGFGAALGLMVDYELVP